MSTDQALTAIKDAEAQVAAIQAAVSAVQSLTPALQSAQAQIQSALTLITQDLNTASAAAQPPPPPPPPPVDPRLVALQKQFGSDKVGVYTGVWTVNDSAAQFGDIATHLMSIGADFALVKMGQGASVWHGDDFAAIRSAFLQRKLGCAPYWYCTPDGGQVQTDYCAKLAKDFGVLVLDIEDEYAHQDIAMQQLLNGVTNAAPDAVVIVSGYGNPSSHFGVGGWPDHTFATAKVTAYQGQFYFGVWTRYLQGSVAAALQWGVDDCFQAFGKGIILQPAINVQGVKSLADFTAAGAFWKPFKASVVIWEYQQVTADIIAAVKKGLQA